MNIKGCHHVGLLVRDMDKSLKFYTEGLGGTITFSFPMKNGNLIHLVDLGGGAVIELIPTGTGEPESGAHWAHLALDTDDARTAHAQAIAAGGVTRDEPMDKMLGTMSVCNSFLFGPDGEVIEFFQVK